MEAAMDSLWLDSKQLVGLPDMPGTDRAIRNKADREGWLWRKRPGRGGGREYSMASLPPKTQKALAMAEQPLAGLSASAAQAGPIASGREAKRLKGEAALARLIPTLSPVRQALSDARFLVVQAFEVFFIHSELGKGQALEAFAHHYNQGELSGISAEVTEALPTLSVRSLERWLSEYSRDGLAGLIDLRDGSHLKGINAFSINPALQSATLALLIDKPHAAAPHIRSLLQQASIDFETGEQLFEVPSYDALKRFLSAWKRRHPETFLAATNPDEWKNRCMSAVGDASADVERLNQRWEMDATPADFMLLDADGTRRRYSCSVVIDIYSRRMIVVLARTPKAQTHKYALRLALLAWGVPEEIVTDNGQDYKAREFLEVLAALHIGHRLTAPFSPWQKPHIERGIGVMLHSVLEMLPNFIGHNVAEREAIRARQAFSERLFQKESTVEVDMAPEELQGHINDWLSGIYEQRRHGDLGATPFELAARWKGQIRRITDERALDHLLAPLKGTRTLQKKGLSVDGGWYASVELYRHVEVGTEVSLRETQDWGELVVYQEDRFVCVATCPERKGISRKELAAHIRNVQAERVRAEKKRLKLALKVMPKDLVGGLLRRKAAEAGKLAVLPGKSIEHQSLGLIEAAKAAERLDKGPRATPLPPELQRRLDERMAKGPAAEEAPKVTRLPETPELRFQKWSELDAQVEQGRVIEDAWELRWWGSYQQTSEFRAMQRRREQSLQAETPPKVKVAAFPFGPNN
jgi:transposase InsO family protein